MILPKETNEEYHKRPELSSSDLKWMLETPYHFKKMVLEKNKLEKKSSDSFDLGSCLHECFLEQDTSQYIVLPKDAPKRPTIPQLKAKVKSDIAIESIEYWEAFDSKNKGKRTIDQKQYDALNYMFDRLVDCPEVMEIYDGCKVEVGATYIDPITGLECKYRPDILNFNMGMLADLKSCNDSSPHAFSKAIARYHYHLSKAHYLTGANQNYPGKISKYTYIAISTIYPHAIGVYPTDPSDILKSMNFRADVMKKIKYCMDNDSWPDWSIYASPISIPSYAYNFSFQD